MLTLLDDEGRRVFAFSPSTDPPMVLFYVSWAHPRGLAICGSREIPCPMIGEDGRTRTGYCLDCHHVGYAALEEARKRGDFHV